MTSGPLVGVKIVEFGGIGPVPFCGMLLSDLGADVVRIDRPNATSDPSDVTARGRRSVTLDLKSDAGIRTALALIDRSEAVMEGFRPGVMERLGLGPKVVLGRKPMLVYGRMTGWGQSGPLAQTAGHDLNYIALTGALHAIGVPNRPVPPLNVIADYGGGSLYLAFGLVSALLHARATGVGQVLDCAMSDGAASLMAMMYGMKAGGQWSNRRGENLLDGGAPFYNVYECSDGQWISIAAIEPQFYTQLLQLMGVVDLDGWDRSDRTKWADLTGKFAAAFALKTRDEWVALLEQTDACFAPVLDFDEAAAHRHNLERETFVTVADVVQPAPAPRFSITPGSIQRPPPSIGQHNDTVFADWGVDVGAQR